MNQDLFYQWCEDLSKHLPSMNLWQSRNLALAGLGVIASESSQLMAIARKMSTERQIESMERRLRRFIDNPNWTMDQFMVEWTRWVVTCLKAKRLHLLVDESKIADRMGVMMLGVAFDGRCIPLAWRCYKGNSAEGYPPEGQVEVIVALLELVRAALPDDTAVLVSADRGIGTSPDLCRRVEGLGFKYLFRITKQCKMRLGAGEWESIFDKARRGEIWQAQGIVFKKRGRLPTNIRTIWDRDCAEPWILITNEAKLSGTEYARRNWQEQSFRDLKSGGWNWSRSFLRCPQRMTRLIAILTVAYAWTISLGCHAVEKGLARPLIRGKTGKPRRQLSLFKEGLRYFSNKIIRNNICPRLYFVEDRRLCR